MSRSKYFCMRLRKKEISFLLGFPNTSFFGKYVKEHFGMTPMEYRNKHNK